LSRGKVVFRSGEGEVPFDIGALTPGSMREINTGAKMPPSCFKPDCRFRITVDIDNSLSEVNESNNSAFGHCPK
jgi:hypothetical protein